MAARLPSLREGHSCAFRQDGERESPTQRLLNKTMSKREGKLHAVGVGVCRHHLLTGPSTHARSASLWLKLSSFAQPTPYSSCADQCLCPPLVADLNHQFEIKRTSARLPTAYALGHAYLFLPTVKYLSDRRQIRFPSCLSRPSSLCLRLVSLSHLEPQLD